VAARFAAGGDLRARAGVVGAVSFVVGLVAAAVVVPVGSAVLRANGGVVLPVPWPVVLRVVVGVGVVAAATAVLAFAAAVLLRRAWAAVLVVVAVLLVPYSVAVVPLLPDEVARWLLRVTPAAGFAVAQTAEEFPQVVAHYAPSTGYFPLPWWAGLLVLCGYTAAAFGLAFRRHSAATSTDLAAQPY